LLFVEGLNIALAMLLIMADTAHHCFGDAAQLIQTSNLKRQLRLASNLYRSMGYLEQN
jgi:hypothetical protein